MTIDAADHAEMMGLVVQQKQAEERLQKAQDELAKWRPRVELARKKGAFDLAQEAAARVADAEREAAAAQLEIEHIANQKSALRFQSKLDDGTAPANTEVLLESFRSLGINPDDGAIDRVAKEQTSEDLLAALKAKMGK